MNLTRRTKMSKQYKTWGKGKAKTVRLDNSPEKKIIIREGEWHINVHRSEVDSLIVALLEMRSAK
jgi:hypothetical protein